MFAYSAERASHARLDDLRRQAYVEAQLQQFQGRPGQRFAGLLRALAALFDKGDPRIDVGPWREDFRSSATGRA